MHLILLEGMYVEEQMSHQYFWHKNGYPLQGTCICLLYNRWMNTFGSQKVKFQMQDQTSKVKLAWDVGIFFREWVGVGIHLCMDTFAASGI